MAGRYRTSSPCSGSSALPRIQADIGNIPSHLGLQTRRIVAAPNQHVSSGRNPHCQRHTTFRAAFASGVSRCESVEALSPLELAARHQSASRPLYSGARGRVSRASRTFALQRPQHPVHVHALHGLHLGSCPVRRLVDGE